MFHFTHPTNDANHPSYSFNAVNDDLTNEENDEDSFAKIQDDLISAHWQANRNVDPQPDPGSGNQEASNFYASNEGKRIICELNWIHGVDETPTEVQQLCIILDVRRVQDSTERRNQKSSLFKAGINPEKDTPPLVQFCVKACCGSGPKVESNQ